MFAVVCDKIRRGITVPDQVRQQEIWNVHLLAGKILGQLSPDNIGAVHLVPPHGKRVKGLNAVQSFVISKDAVTDTAQLVCIIFYFVFYDKRNPPVNHFQDIGKGRDTLVCSEQPELLELLKGIVFEVSLDAADTV